MRKRTDNQRHAPMTMHEVARAAKVSIGTVSRAINDRSKVRPATLLRVDEAIQRMGWQPNAVASSMRTGATRTIGIILPDIQNPLFSAVARSVERVLRERGHTLLFTNSDDEPGRDVELITLLLQRRVDGLLYSPSDESDPQIIATVRNAMNMTRTPIVLIERSLPIAMDAVASDQSGGLRRATEYLISLGHRRIALLSVSTRSQAGRERHRGFDDACREAGIVLDPSLQRPECTTADDSFRECLALLQSPSPPTALIAGGNMLLAGVLRALNLLRKTVPKDLSVVTVGDTDLALLAPPSFTAVRWDVMALGREAALLMLENIASKKLHSREPRSVLVPTEIVLRQSCAAVAP